MSAYVSHVLIKQTIEAPSAKWGSIVNDGDIRILDGDSRTQEFASLSLSSVFYTRA